MIVSRTCSSVNPADHTTSWTRRPGDTDTTAADVPLPLAASLSSTGRILVPRFNGGQPFPPGLVFCDPAGRNRCDRRIGGCDRCGGQLGVRRGDFPGQQVQLPRRVRTSWR
jgi:hypothetical protein